jgi:hypothetical protein
MRKDTVTIMVRNIIASVSRREDVCGYDCVDLCTRYEVGEILCIECLVLGIIIALMTSMHELCEFMYVGCR